MSITAEFLRRLQSADEATKRRWLIGLSAALMLVVIAVWLAYFNTMFEPVGGGQASASPAGESFSPWAAMKSVASLVGETVAGWFR